MDLHADDFELFGLPRQFSQDAALIDARWKALQREAHPDQAAAQGAAAQRVALQWSVRINEAYKRLKDPLARAAYLCELRGVPIAAETNTTMPREFLMEQMAWRETLDEAGDEAALAALQGQVQAARAGTLASAQHLLDGQGDALAAAQQVRALMFIERFQGELRARLDRLSA